MSASSFGMLDQVAFVTGASQGIVRVMGLAMARHGAHVALVGLNAERAAGVKAEIEAMGRKALIVRADLLHVPQIRAMAEQVHSHYGRIDNLVNNADWTGTTAA